MDVCCIIRDSIIDEGVGFLKDIIDLEHEKRITIASFCSLQICFSMALFL